MRLLLSTAVVALLANATAAGDRAQASVAVRAVQVPVHPGTVTLPRFALFGWVAPPADSTTPARYAELAEAGLNVTVLAWEDPGIVPENLRRLRYSAPFGVQNLLLDQRLDRVHEHEPSSMAVLDSIVTAYRDQPAFLGYYLGDEPGTERFSRLGEWFRLLRAHDPLHPAWNNLIGRSAFVSREAWLGYMRDYIEATQPAVLCTDHYDHLVGRDRGFMCVHLTQNAFDDRLGKPQCLAQIANGLAGLIGDVVGHHRAM